MWRFLVIVFQEEQLVPPIQKLHALQLACYAHTGQCRVCGNHQLASIHVLQAAGETLLCWSSVISIRCHIHHLLHRVVQHACGIWVITCMYSTSPCRTGSCIAHVLTMLVVHVATGVLRLLRCVDISLPPIQRQQHTPTSVWQSRAIDLDLHARM